MSHSRIGLATVGVLIGFPRPKVKPLVPSGILGPLVICLEDASNRVEPLDCGDGARRPLPEVICVRPRGFPRPRAHAFFDPLEFSSAYQNVSYM